MLVGPTPVRRRTILISTLASLALPGSDATAPTLSVPVKRAERHFFLQSDGSGKEPVLYVMDSRKASPRKLIDPATLSPDGSVTLLSHTPSANGKLLAYAVGKPGSESREVRIRDVGSGRDLPDTVRMSRPSRIAWTYDNKGFLYSRYDEASGGTSPGELRYHKLYYHRINSRQIDDQLVYDRPDEPDWRFDAQVNYDGQFIIISITGKTDSMNRIYLIDVGNPSKPTIDNPIVKLIDRFDSRYDYVGNGGFMFLFRTNRDAPRGRVFAMDINTPREDRWRTVIPESQDTLIDATVGGDLVVAKYARAAGSSMLLYDPVPPQLRNPQRRSRSGGEGGGRGERESRGDSGFRADSAAQQRGLGSFPFVGEIALPGSGTVEEISAMDGDPFVFYSFLAPQQSRTIFRFDLKKRKSEIFSPKIEGKK
jgi:prolyl oligopeptidase